MKPGANHYTKKPYDIQEIDFLIQRFCKKGSPISNSISIGDYQLELSTHKLFYKQEQSKTLSPKDFKLFYLLSEQLNQPVSREKLFHEIWDGQEVHDSLKEQQHFLALFAQIIGKRYHTFNRCRKRSWIYIIKKRPTLLIVIKGGYFVDFPIA